MSASLFNVFDADRNGTLSVTEVVQGVLLARGDAKRSDVLAGVLGVRALQETVQKFKIQHTCSQNELSQKFDLVAAQQGLLSSNCSKLGSGSDLSIHFDENLANMQVNGSIDSDPVKEAEFYPSNEFDDDDGDVVVQCGSLRRLEEVKKNLDLMLVAGQQGEERREVEQSKDSGFLGEVPAEAVLDI